MILRPGLRPVFGYEYEGQYEGQVAVFMICGRLDSVCALIPLDGIRACCVASPLVAEMIPVMFRLPHRAAKQCGRALPYGYNEFHSSHHR
jgi:hypothetical protein